MLQVFPEGKKGYGITLPICLLFLQVLKALLHSEVSLKSATELEVRHFIKITSQY